MDKKAQEQEQAMMKEFVKYLFHVAWPILIIVVIAKVWGPSY